MTENEKLKDHREDPRVAYVSSEEAAFTLEQVQLQFDLSNKLQRLLVENNKMYIFTTTHVYRINLESPSDVLAVQLPSQMDSNKLNNAWLHPSGEFLIIQMNSTFYYHLHICYKKFKSLPRFKGLRVTYIAFHKQKKENSTSDFLLATKDGHVLVANINYHDPETEDSKRDDKYVKQIFSTKKAIQGLMFSNNGTRVVVALESELMSWDCFEPSLSELSRSLHHPPLTEKLPGSGSFFTMNSSYYYFVHSATGLIISNDPEVKPTAGHLSSLVKSDFLIGSQSFMTSKYYIFYLSLGADRLLISNKLSPQSLRSMQLPSITENENFLGITSDNLGKTHWVFTKNKIYELIITNEDASAWYKYYKLGEYDHALQLIESGKDSELQQLKKNVILVKQGYDLLQRGGFGVSGDQDDTLGEMKRLKLQNEGIKKLALSNEPFEKVCLMLMSVDKVEDQMSSSHELMITYIQSKLDNSDGPEKNRVKEIVLSSWIVRLFLSSMRNISTTVSVLTNEENKSLLRIKHNKLKKELFSFLEAKSKILDRKTIYSMMEDLGFTDELLEFAGILLDFEFIVQFHIQSESWTNALKAMTRAHKSRSEVFEHLIYKTSTILLINCPKETTQCWLKFPEIDYEKLIPAILAYKRFEVEGSPGNNATSKFLSILIFEKEVKSKALSECYLSLLIMNSTSEDSSSSSNSIIKTLEYLRKNGNNEDRKVLYYGPTFMLRACLRFKRIEPAIDILVNDLRLHKEALSTALKYNLIPQAEMVLRNYEDANQEPINHEAISDLSDSIDKEAVDPSRSKLEDDKNSVRRHLWVSYAKHVIDLVCKDQNFGLDSMSNLTHTHDRTNAHEIKKEENLKTYTKIEPGNSKAVISKELSLSSRLSEVLRYLLQLSFSVKENASVLSIKDLLPLLPESIMISNFKAEIVDSLSIFNDKINQLGLEMQESSITAEKLKVQLNESKFLERRGHVFTIIEPGESCNLCRKLLVRKKFILFPNCHHGFHKDCMIRYLLQSKGDYTFKRSFRNFKLFSSIVDKNELDELLLKECLLCNESKLNTIDDSVIDAERNDAQDWEI